MAGVARTSLLGLILGFAMMAFSGASASAEDGGAFVDSVFRGQNGPPERENHVVKTNGEWTALWARVDQEPPRTLKEGTQTGIAVFAGQRQTGGYRLEVRRVDHTAEMLTVNLELIVPGSIAAQVITAPYIFAIVDKVSQDTEVALKDPENVPATNTLHGR